MEVIQPRQVHQCSEGGYARLLIQTGIDQGACGRERGLCHDQYSPCPDPRESSSSIKPDASSASSMSSSVKPSKSARFHAVFVSKKLMQTSKLFIGQEIGRAHV